MRKTIFIFLLIVLSSCNDKQTKKKFEQKSSDLENINLNGIWAENEIDNAIFEITDDTLRYVEHYENVYINALENKNFIIKTLNGEILSNNEIIKITNDSLVLKDDDGSLIKLYKRNK